MKNGSKVQRICIQKHNIIKSNIQYNIIYIIIFCPLHNSKSLLIKIIEKFKKPKQIFLINFLNNKNNNNH